MPLKGNTNVTTTTNTMTVPITKEEKKKARVDSAQEKQMEDLTPLAETIVMVDQVRSEEEMIAMTIASEVVTVGVTRVIMIVKQIDEQLWRITTIIVVVTRMKWDGL